MVGVCGVAPKPGLDVHCAVPGDHGSNLDTKMIKVGSRVYLPVAVPGAGLAVGDLHACMGDGELSGHGDRDPRPDLHQDDGIPGPACGAPCH